MDMKANPKKLNFTKESIERLPPPFSGRTYFYDAKIPGLALCVTAANSRTFYTYRKVNGKPERIRIGAWPELTVEQARTHAAQHNGVIAEGRNPNDKRRDYRNAPPLKQVFDEFIELPTRTKAKRPKSPRTIHEYKLQFNAYLADWHGRKMSSITRADVEKLHNQLATANGHYVANRVLALVKALFNTAIDLGYFNANPAARLSGFAEESRERFLQADELPRFWEALEAEPSEKLRDFFKLALFTGQRRSNVLAMRWSDINLDRGLWTIPRTKTGRHEVPLTSEAIDVLQRRQRFKGDCEFVFPGRHGREHLRDPMRQWREILKRAGIENLRIHDLRRSLGSWQTITGASLQVVGKTLGHTRPETTAIYSRLNDDPVRTAMGAATAAIMAAAKPEKPKRGRKAKVREGNINDG